MASFLGVAQDIPAANVEAGWIIEARATGDFGAKEILPRFFRLHVPEIQVPVAQSRVEPWVRAVEFNNVVYDEPTDTYILDLEAGNASATNGRITQDEAEAPVGLIGGTVGDDTANGVEISVPVHDLIVQWIRHERQNIPSDRFTYISQELGIYTFDFDYSGLAGHTAAAKHVMALGGEVVDQDVATGTLRFSMDKAGAMDAAQTFVRGELTIRILRASWSLTAGALTTILANEGEMEVTQSQLLGNIMDLRL